TLPSVRQTPKTPDIVPTPRGCSTLHACNDSAGSTPVSSTWKPPNSCFTCVPCSRSTLPPFQVVTTTNVSTASSPTVWHKRRSSGGSCTIPAGTSDTPCGWRTPSSTSTTTCTGSTCRATVLGRTSASCVPGWLVSR